MATIIVCDMCGTVLSDDFGHRHPYYAIRTVLFPPRFSSISPEKDEERSYALCPDCFKKLKEDMAHLTDMNFKGKVHMTHILLGMTTNEKGNNDED